jgi:murein DD-endopeptidase MepM/ murein hydrolase activator NlpD
MRPLGILLLGAVIGAGGTILYLNQMPLPDSTETPVVAPAPAATAPTAPAQQASPATPPPSDEDQPRASPPPTTPGQAAANWAMSPQSSGASGGGNTGSSGGSAATSPVEGLQVPVAGVTVAQLSDTFNQSRGSERRHEALDILAPRGTPVVAAADATVVKLFNSKPGGLTVYTFDPTERYSYYYAHLDHYVNSLQEGQHLKKGDLIGYVGTTGNADPGTPHLHFAVFELGPEKHWWQGAPINPYPMFNRHQ